MVRLLFSVVVCLSIYRKAISITPEGLLFFKQGTFHLGCFMPIHMFGNNYHDIEFLVVSYHFTLENLMNRTCMAQKHVTLFFNKSGSACVHLDKFGLYIFSKCC